MIFGLSTFGEHALGELDAAYDESVSSPISFLLSDPDADLIFVLVAAPPDFTVGPAYGLPYVFGDQPLGGLTDEDAAGPSPIYLSDVGFTTDPDDTPASTIMPAVLAEPFSFQTAIALDGSGTVDASFGAIRILNGDADANGDSMPAGEMDYLLGKAWAGWTVEIYVGGTFNVGRADERRLSFTEFGLFFRGQVGRPSAARGEIVLPILDHMARLDTLLNAGTYAGTGGLEGDAEVAGVNKPKAFGQVRNISGVLIDAVSLVWQFHDGVVQAFDEVRDNGVALPVDADYPDYAALIAAIIPLGFCATCKALGLMRHSAAPAGAITADVKGDATGGYVSTPGAIVRRMATTAGASPLADPAEIDAVAFADLEIAAPYVSGFYSGTVPVTVADACRTVIRDVGFVTFDRIGRLTVGILDAPSDAPVAAHGESDIAESPVEMETLEPVYRWTLGYRRNHTVQEADSLGAISASARRDYSQPERLTASAEASGVRTIFPLAEDRRDSTLLDEEADAAAERDRRLRRDKVARQLHTVDLVAAPFQAKLGETRRLIHARHGLSLGRDGVVVGIAESARKRVSTVTLMV